MQFTIKRSLGSTLLAASLIWIGYRAAQQGSSQQPTVTQSTLPQQNKPSRDQLEQLETRMRDLQAAIDNLRTVRAQDREDLEQALRTEDRNEKRIDKLGQQVSKIMFDLDRVKTKVGLY